MTVSLRVTIADCESSRDQLLALSMHRFELPSGTRPVGVDPAFDISIN